VLRQTEQNYEIILADDGSTDGSGAICDAYAEKFPDKIRVIHKQNEGLLLTRRRLFKEAKGEFVVNVDSDDYLLKDDALEILHDVIIRHQCDLVIFNYYAEGDSPGKGEVKKPIDEDNETVFDKDNMKTLYLWMIRGKMHSMHSKAIRRTIIDIDAPFKPQRTDGEDMVSLPDINNPAKLRLLPKSSAEDVIQAPPIVTSAARIVYLDDTLYFYRFNASSLTKKKLHIEKMFSEYRDFTNIWELWDTYISLWEIEEHAAIAYERRVSKVCRMVYQAFDYARTERKKAEFQDFVRKLSKDDCFHKLFMSRAYGNYTWLILMLIRKDRADLLWLVLSLSQR
jgi:glycosyltransferase involved in cell wall biosynthesis